MADLVPMPFSLNFVNFMGNFCKVFAAYKQVRDSSAFLYQIAEFLLFVCHNVFVFTVSKTYVVLSHGIYLTL